MFSLNWIQKDTNVVTNQAMIVGRAYSLMYGRMASLTMIYVYLQIGLNESRGLLHIPTGFCYAC